MFDKFIFNKEVSSDEVKSFEFPVINLRPPLDTADEFIIVDKLAQA